MKPETKILREAESRWDEVVLATRCADLCRLSESTHRLLVEQEVTVAQVLAAFEGEQAAIKNPLVKILRELSKDLDLMLKQLDEDLPKSITDDFESMQNRISKMAEIVKQEGAKEALLSDDAKGLLITARKLANDKNVRKVVATLGAEALYRGIMDAMAEMLPLFKIVKSIANIAGAFKLVKKQFKKLTDRAREVGPDEAFLDFAGQIARGPDSSRLKGFASKLQMNDDIEAVMDDEVEKDFLKLWIKQLRDLASSDPNQPVPDINVAVKDYVKSLGQGQAELGLSVS